MINNFPEKVLNFTNPSAKSLEDSLIKYQTHKRTSKLNEVREISKNILFNLLIPYYEKIDIDTGLSTFNFMAEPLKNSFFHSEGDKNIDLNLIISPSSFIFGINDGGSYFKRPEIKQYWESRKKYPERHKSQLKEMGFGIGTGLVYGLADFIYVENSSGTLYLGSKVPGKLFRTRN